MDNKVPTTMFVYLSQLYLQHFYYPRGGRYECITPFCSDMTETAPLGNLYLKLDSFVLKPLIVTTDPLQMHHLNTLRRHDDSIEWSD